MNKSEIIEAIRTLNFVLSTKSISEALRKKTLEKMEKLIDLL